MSRTLRRYEVLLPLRFNDGQAVPDGLIVDALVEIEQRFGAVPRETQTIQGRWRYGGEAYRDDLVRAFVDVEDLAEHREFFLAFKQRMKERFGQLDLWMTTYLIEVL